MIPKYVQQIDSCHSCTLLRLHDSHTYPSVVQIPRKKKRLHDSTVFPIRCRADWRWWCPSTKKWRSFRIFQLLRIGLLSCCLQTTYSPPEHEQHNTFRHEMVLLKPETESKGAKKKIRCAERKRFNQTKSKRRKTSLFFASLRGWLLKCFQRTQSQCTPGCKFIGRVARHSK